MKINEELDEYFYSGKFNPDKCDSEEMIEIYRDWLKTASKEKIDTDTYDMYIDTDRSKY